MKMNTASVNKFQAAGALLASAVLISFFSLASGAAQAMGKKPAPVPAQLTGKRVVHLDPVRNVRIQMPDQKYHDFGEDFAQRLENDLYNSGRYLIDKPLVHPVGVSSLAARSLSRDLPDYAWVGTTVPSATLSIKVEAMSFQTGARGDRMFYGFNERFRTPFNDGFTERPNEFPLREADSTSVSDSKTPGWFEHIFDKRGIAPFDSQSGLDLGDGFKIDVLFAWLAVKYAVYHAELHLRLGIDAPLAGLKEFRLITVKGEGYYYDIAGAYEGYSLGISIARRDAMSYALQNAISGTYAAIDRAVAPLPLTARIDAISANGSILLGTGINAAIVPRTRYELIGHPETLLEAVESNSSGTVMKVVQGDAKYAVLGAYAREALAGLAAPTLPKAQEGSEVFDVLGSAVAPGTEDSAQSMGPAASTRVAMRDLAQIDPDGLASATAGQLAAIDVPAAIENITLPWKNAPKSDLQGKAPSVSWLQAFWKSLVETLFLPYRIWRYYQYDQIYRGSPMQTYASVDENGVATIASEASDRGNWPRMAREQVWAQQIGLDLAPAMNPQTAPVVAIIDSGVDYNHWTIHDHLWANPNPIDLGSAGPADRKDFYGWDFISGDSHPYDDGYHGTGIASLVTAVAPSSKIMPLKVFNPWGITSSAAIYGAFEYAVKHGAKVIVCAWATRLNSQAITQGVAYARQAGVLVVAAAGDRGEDLAQTPAFPAALAGRYDNVLTVAAVSSQDKLVQTTSSSSNFGVDHVAIAAPGQSIAVSAPLSGQRRSTSTGNAAAITAGAVARMLAAMPSDTENAPATWIQTLRSESVADPSLDDHVAGGARLWIRH